MDWITDTLAIGGLRDAIDFQLLEEEGIEALLQLCGHEREQVFIPLPLEHLQLPVEDRRPLPPHALSQGANSSAGIRWRAAVPWSAAARG